MLNAEDTKERIRKLRLKVISDPTDINSTNNTQDVQKTSNGLEDKLVVKNENNLGHGGNLKKGLNLTIDWYIKNSHMHWQSG